MGARGGYSRVVRFQCTTCGHDRMTVASAIRCCNAEMRDQEEKQAKTLVKRMMGKATKPRISFKKEFGTHGDREAVATAKCPYKTCDHICQVVVRIGKRYYGPNLSKDEAVKKAVALAKAQLSKHIKNSWAHSN